MEKPENIIDLGEYKFNKNREIFSSIAAEIRSGVLQTHFGDNKFLFALTDEILHFSLMGESLKSDMTEYESKCAEATQEILRNIKKIIEYLSQHPKDNCPAIRQNAIKINSLAEEIKISL